jgi:hypothetical protein
MRKFLGLLVGLAFVWACSAAPALAQNTAIGSDKCAKLCHKVQFESWSKSKHAAGTGDKKADCETCHGNGSAFFKIALKKAKDPAAGKAAGLIAKPDKTSCNKCHKPGEITDAMYAKVHAHKS